MYMARLRADVMLNNHFAILATVLDPIKAEYQISEIRKYFGNSVFALN